MCMSEQVLYGRPPPLRCGACLRRGRGCRERNCIMHFLLSRVASPSHDRVTTRVATASRSRRVTCSVGVGRSALRSPTSLVSAVIQWNVCYSCGMTAAIPHGSSCSRSIRSARLSSSVPLSITVKIFHTHKTRVLQSDSVSSKESMAHMLSSSQEEVWTA
jgi:hypothetical protein